jgi:hypothetical protein
VAGLPSTLEAVPTKEIVALPTRNSCRIVVGRLLEIEVRDGYRTVADIDELAQKLTATIASVPLTVRPVIVADWRSCNVLTPPVAEAAVTMMSSVNARIERSALLHAADASTSVFQLMRLVKETSVPYRRMFTEPSQLQLWLGEILSDEENERLRAFLLGTRR